LACLHDDFSIPRDPDKVPHDQKGLF